MIEYYVVQRDGNHNSLVSGPFPTGPHARDWIAENSKDGLVYFVVKTF